MSTILSSPISSSVVFLLWNSHSYNTSFSSKEVAPDPLPSISRWVAFLHTLVSTHQECSNNSESHTHSPCCDELGSSVWTLSDKIAHRIWSHTRASRSLFVQAQASSTYSPFPWSVSALGISWIIRRFWPFSGKKWPSQSRISSLYKRVNFPVSISSHRGTCLLPTPATDWIIEPRTCHWARTNQTILWESSLLAHCCHYWKCSALS